MAEQISLYKESRFGDASNYCSIGTDGAITYVGTAKRHLSMRPFIEIGDIAVQEKPTVVTYGVTKGYSLPLYATNEEIFISEYIVGRWDGASNITLSIIGYLDTGVTDGKDFALQVSWVNKSTSSGIIPATSTDVTVWTDCPSPRNAQYSIYKVDFAIDWDLNDPDIVASDFFSARIRRLPVGVGYSELDGGAEFVVTSIMIQYVIDKVFKA